MATFVIRTRRGLGSLVLLLAACGPRVLGDDSSAGGEGEGSAGDDPGASGSGAMTPGMAEGDEGPTSVGSTTDDHQDSLDSSSGEPVPIGCLPAELHGMFRPDLSIPGLTTYEGCGQERFVIEHVGSELVTTAGALSAIRTEAMLFPGQVRGLFGVGVTLCCEGMDAACIGLYAEAETSMIDLVEYVDSSLPRSDECYGLVVIEGEPPSGD